MAVPVLAAGATLFAIDVGARRSIARFEADLVVEREAERVRAAAVRCPVLRGPPIEENAAPRYREVLAAIRPLITTNSLGSCWQGARRPLEERVAPDETALVESCRSQLAALREATRCTRCDWDYAHSGRDPLPSNVESHFLVNLLTIEGHRRLDANDSRGAVECWLDGLRFATDVGEGSLLAAGNEYHVHGLAAKPLAALILAGAPDGPLAEIARGLDLLEPRLPSAAVALRQDRIDTIAIYLSTSQEEAEAEGLLKKLPRARYLPWRPMIANAIETFDAVSRDLERAAASGDPGEIARVDAFAAELGRRTWNPLLEPLLRSLGERAPFLEELRASHRLLAAAVAIERRAKVAGAYPTDATEADLPVDPCDRAGGRLRYERTACGYRLSSVGSRRQRDDGFSTPLLVLERVIP